MRILKGTRRTEITLGVDGPDGLDGMKRTKTMRMMKITKVRTKAMKK